jgi:hypothetical protein
VSEIRIAKRSRGGSGSATPPPTSLADPYPHSATIARVTSSSKPPRIGERAWLESQRDQPCAIVADLSLLLVAIEVGKPDVMERVAADLVTGQREVLELLQGET